MDVSIIIVNYFTSELVKNCIASIEKFSNGFSYEIIVVDNSGNNEEFEKIVEICRVFKNSRGIFTGENLGFGRANNLGRSEAYGEYLFFLNSDTLLKNNAISILLESFKKLDKAGALIPSLYDKDDRLNTAFVDDEKVLYKATRIFSPCLVFRTFRHNLKQNNTGKIKEINGYISGAAFFVKTNIFDEVGGFDKDIFMYAEDAELSMLIRNKGYKLYSIPFAEVTHFEGMSDETIYSDFKVKNYVEGNCIFVKKVFGDKKLEMHIKSSINAYRLKSILLKLMGKRASSDNKSKLMNEYKKYLD